MYSALFGRENADDFPLRRSIVVTCSTLMCARFNLQALMSTDN